MTRTKADDVQSPEERDDALMPSLAAQFHEADAALAGAEPTRKRILALAMSPSTCTNDWELIGSVAVALSADHTGHIWTDN